MLPRRLSAVETAKVLPYLHEFAGERVLQGVYDGACLNGNNMTLRRDVLTEAGGFDASFLHGADADLTRRLLAGGHRLLRTTDPLVTHLKQDSLATHLRTRFLRGSTVRFAMRDGSYRAWHPLRALLKSLMDLPRDLARLRGLSALRRPVPLASRVLAPLVNLLGGAVNAVGQAWFHMRFLREDGGDRSRPSRDL